MLEISFGGSLEKVVAPMFVCMPVCPSTFASEARTGDPIRMGVCSFNASDGGKTMVPVLDQSDACDTCNVQSREPSQKIMVKAVGYTNDRIRLKPGGPLATIGGLNPLGLATVAPISHE